MPSSLFNQPQEQNKSLQATVAELIKDKDPKEVFYSECKKRGVNPNTILSLAKMFRK